VIAVLLVRASQIGHPPHESVRQPVRQPVGEAIRELVGELIHNGVRQPIVTRQSDDRVGAS
jgi:hypothetical protein